MDLSLVGRRALVCGSSQGIGRAAAHELALLGAECVLLARSEAKLQSAAAALSAEHGLRHGWLAADFADPDAVAAVAARAVAEGPIHILVNNTGGPPGGPAHAASPEAYLAAFRAHVICNQILVQACLPGMKAAGFGRIVNVISTSVKAPIPNLGVSNTIRAAVANWSKTLSMELAPLGITVNNVLPGYTDTQRLAELFTARAEKAGQDYEQVLADAVTTIPAGRLGRAEEVAAAIAFLASPAAAYINGVNLPVDGGRTPSL